MAKKRTAHIVGNAHIDPVWLWSFPEGLAEIKATFQAAIDRIYEYDEFVFTSACAFYYKWVEENCPALFEEIRVAVKNGKWRIVGGMWIQPDCNIPSSESFARQMLYSQRYFWSRFGLYARTGYNVDSFGHSAGLPRLLWQGGMENYVFMRPNSTDEKSYPFTDHAFRWKCGENEVLAFRIYRRYGERPRDGSVMDNYDARFSDVPYDFMLFLGVGNHGGGPTVENIETVLATRKGRENDYVFSHPDAYFDTLRRDSFDALPLYEGELQNHASGCYAANAGIKRYNRLCESRLSESERFGVLAAHLLGDRGIADAAKNRVAWEAVMFNQFHDIICGCAQRSSYEDAYAFAASAIAHAKRETNFAVQRISWAVNTAKGSVCRTKDHGSRAVWETDALGAPTVVLNPLSHPVTIPVHLNRFGSPVCDSVSDEHGVHVPVQTVRAEYTNKENKYATHFMATAPAFGWRTYYAHTASEDAVTVGEDAQLSVSLHEIRNGRVTVSFDENSGVMRSYRVDGEERLGAFGARAALIDDSENDTWSHKHFVFDREIGAFGSPVFTVLESGLCEVSLSVKQTYGGSVLEQIYTLYPNDPRVHVRVRLFYREFLALLRLSFDSGLTAPTFTREVPGGVADAPTNGREMPMLRYAMLSENGKGIALLNDSKYSVMAKDGVFGFVLARSCFYGDHYGVRDERMDLQDMGEQECAYVLMPYDGDLSAVERAAEELNTVFPVICETYHEGELSESGSFFSSDAENLALTALKFAEDGRGIIVRLSETAGRTADADVTVLKTTFRVTAAPFAILSFRIWDGRVIPCNFIEDAV